MSFVDERTLPQGIDLSCPPRLGLQSTGRVLDQATGLQAYLEALARAVQTEKGELWDLPEYGLDVAKFVGRGLSDSALTFICSVELKIALQWEAERIRELVSIDVTKVGNSLFATIITVPVGFEQPVTLKSLEVARVG